METDNSIVFYTDFNCPFCYALNERLIALGDKSKIEWRGIEHDPSVTSQQVSLAEKNKLINQVNIIRKRAQEVDIVTPLFRPNTGLANRIVYLMRNQSKPKLVQCRTLIYRALWLDGLDISTHQVLKEIVKTAQLAYPSAEEICQKIDDLKDWQAQWTGTRFNSRLPVLVSMATDKPLLGFPTHELLHYFFNGIDLPIAPESLAACQFKPKQNILALGAINKDRCNMVELEAAYQIVNKRTIAEGKKWIAEQECRPDVILLDHFSLQQHSIDFCRELKQSKHCRDIAVIFLLEKIDSDLEMEAFDVGASDVFFDLSNPKVCQARFDTQLRVKQTTTLLDALARLDYLTELANRGEFDRKFEEEWYRAVRSGLPLSIVLFDIDFFKLYNDHYGHQLGDDCLRQVANAMAGQIQRSTDFLARYGGEEFVVIFAQTNASGALKYADEIRLAVEKMALPHDKSLVNPSITLSGGVATMLPSKNSQPSQLLLLADDALYQAKSAGRNCVILHDKSNDTG
jgi:diguanylate cyclase (GGDEF)-like protein